MPASTATHTSLAHVSPELQVLLDKHRCPAPPCPTVADPHAAITATPMKRTALDFQSRMRGSYLTPIHLDNDCANAARSATISTGTARPKLNGDPTAARAARPDVVRQYIVVARGRRSVQCRRSAHRAEVG